METRILAIIKRMLGYEVDYEPFDQEIIIFVNSALGRLCQLGIGTPQTMRINGYDETIDIFMVDGYILNECLELIYLNVKLVFDPPQNSFLVNAIKDNIEKKEWLINCAVETPV